jgi:proline dehydrogenase
MNITLPFFLASRFVASETLDGALPAVKALNRKGLRVALDLLGEYEEDRRRAEAATETYIQLVRRLAAEREQGNLQHANISIKLSMMGQMIDADFCFENLLDLLEVAEEHDIYVRLDMEGSDTTASTLHLFERAWEEYPGRVGPVLQAMLKRTARDVKRVCELGASVRLCKGAYKEPRAIAYQNMDQIRERFTAYMKRLLTSAASSDDGATYPGIATHDDILVTRTKLHGAENRIPKSAFEFQMLYGLRSETQQEMAAEGYNMLVYVPYGTEWFPYFSRRLAERKENVWFILKNLFRR